MASLIDAIRLNSMILQRHQLVERLVSKLHDDEITAAETKQLEDLLLNDSELQSLYFDMVDVHVALGISSATMHGDEVECQLSSNPCAQNSAHAAPSVSWPGGAYAIATAFACVALFAWSWHMMSPAPRFVAEAPRLEFGLGRVPKIERVSWNGTTYSSDVSDWRPVDVAKAGAVPLEQLGGEVVDGYMVCLPPGHELEVVTTCDATAENCLSIEELETDPTPSSRKVTFHNTGESERPFHANPAAESRRYGIVGSWSCRNLESRVRYFLLTGVHRRVGAEPEEEWRVSEMAVIVEEEDVVHIGWDDSGPFPSVKGDRDFDDLSASIIIRPLPASAVAPIARGLAENRRPRVIKEKMDAATARPPHPSDEEVSGVRAVRYVIEIPPETVTIMKGASNASAHNEVAAVEAKTEELLWRASNENGTLTNVGGVAIRNDSPETRIVELMATGSEQASGEQDSGRHVRVRLLFSQSGYSILGFDDGVRPDADYNDIRVGVLHLPLYPRKPSF